LRLFAHYAYRLTKADTTGLLFERVLRTLEGTPPVQFLLEDYPDASGIPRVMKRFPALAPFEHRALHAAGHTMVHLVHLEARFREHVPGGLRTGIDVPCLASIANGIPRSFPVHNAVFYFADVPWAGVSAQDPFGPAGTCYAGPPLPANPVPGILLTSHWWSTRRRIELHATVPLATPAPAAREPPAVSGVVLGKLRELGHFRPPELRVLLEASEGLTPADASRLNEIVRSWNAGLPALLDDLSLPHALSPEPGPESGSGLTSPHKAALVSTFRPRGWKYLPNESGQGFFSLTKESARGNKIGLYFDVGSTSHSCSSFAVVEGPGWRAAFRIAFVRGYGRPQYPIAGDTAWARIVENIAVVVEHLERTSLARAEDLSPPAPAWFARTT
jgi:hypothetical protein